MCGFASRKFSFALFLRTAWQHLGLTAGTAAASALANVQRLSKRSDVALSDGDWWQEFYGSACPLTPSSKSELRRVSFTLSDAVLQRLHCAIGYDPNGQFGMMLHSVSEDAWQTEVEMLFKSACCGGRRAEAEATAEAPALQVEKPANATAETPPSEGPSMLDTLSYLLEEEVGAKLVLSREPLSGSVSAALRLVQALHQRVQDAFAYVLLLRAGLVPKGLFQHPGIDKKPEKGDGGREADPLLSPRESTIYMASNAMALGTWRVNLDDNKKFQAAKRKHFIALMGNAHFQSLFHKTRRITLLEARVDERFATALEPFLAEAEEQPQQDQAAGKDNERKKKRDQKNMNFWIPGLPGVAYPVVDAGDDTLEELPVLAELRALGPLNVSSLLAAGAGSGASTPASSTTSNSIFPVLDAGRVKSGCNAAVLPDFCAHLSRMKFRHEISTYTFEPTKLRLIKSGAWSEVREGSSASAECPSNTGLLIVYNGGAANEPALDLVSPEAGGEDVRIPPGRGAVVDDCRFPGLRVAPSSSASGGNTKNPNALVPVLFVRMWHPLVPPSERVRQATLLLEQRVPPKDVEKMQKTIMRLGRERWGEVARTWLQREKGTILTEESLQAGRGVYFRSDNGPRPDLEAGVAGVGGRDEL